MIAAMMTQAASPRQPKRRAIRHVIRKTNATRTVPIANIVRKYGSQTIGISHHLTRSPRARIPITIAPATTPPANAPATRRAQLQ